MLESVNTYSSYDSNIPSFVRISDTAGRKSYSPPRATVQKSRYKKVWNPEVLQKLFLFIKDEIEYTKIASILGVTEHALKCQIKRLKESEKKWADLLEESKKEEIHTVKREGKGHKEIQYEIDRAGCWICISHVYDNNEYIQLKVNKKLVTLHRYMYEQFKGPIPEGFGVYHGCGNARCVNPDHLLKAEREDIQRIITEKRRARGEEPMNSKLTIEQVHEIKDLVGKGLSQRSVARKFGICHKTVSNICTGKTWGRLL